MSPEFLDGFQYGFAGVMVFYFIMRLWDFVLDRHCKNCRNKSQQPPKEG